MIEAAKISLTKMRNSILTHGALACVIYIAFFMLMKLLNLINVIELRWVNYVLLCLVCIYQIRKWVRKTGNYVPFLTVFFTSFFTGIFSFILFGVFLEIFLRLDAEFYNIVMENTPGSLRALPSATVLFEGSAVSIIVAFICLQYFRRYEEEVTPKKD
jgi:hypothetical protein